MKKNKEEEELVEEWLLFAKENLLFARSGMKEDYSPYHTICFLCQSSSEKYLKAFLIWNGWKLQRIHDLNELLIFCTDFDSEFENLNEDCVVLNEYITISRYPGDLPFESINRNDAEEAIQAATKIEMLVEEKLEK